MHTFLTRFIGSDKKLCMETLKNEDYIEEPPGGRDLTRECADLIKLNQKMKIKHQKVEEMLQELMEKKPGERKVR